MYGRGRSGGQRGQHECGKDQSLHIRCNFVSSVSVRLKYKNIAKFGICFVHLLTKNEISRSESEDSERKRRVGKTYQLAYKYVRDVIDQPLLYRHILAVTFTNKATEEMKSRILKEIHTLASGAPSPYLTQLCSELRLDERSVRRRAAEVRSKILHDYSRFTVLTIDTFSSAFCAPSSRSWGST